MPTNRYLQKRRQGWYVRIAVPPSLVSDIGKTHILKSLKTRDVAVARERRWSAIDEIHRMFHEAGSTAASDPIVLGLKDRAWWAAASAEGRDEMGYTPRDHAEHVLYETAEEIERAQGLKAATRYYKIATGNAPVLADAVSLWLDDIKGAVAEQTRGHHRAALKLFQESAPDALFVQNVDRQLAGHFVTAVLKRSGRAAKTCNRILSSLSSCWRWMQRRGFTADNPWRGQGEYNKKRRSKTKRPFTAEEITRLLKSDPVAVLGRRYGGAVVALQRLGLMTGARLNELCELRAEDVSSNDCSIHIREGKTDSAARSIPIHPSVWPLMEERLRAATEGTGQIFPELDPGGPDQKRSWYVSKRFTIYRRAILGESSEVDFHSFRRCFATYLERAQSISGAVYPSVIDELMGHKKQTLALSLYSGGLRRDHLQAAIRAMVDAIEPEVLNAVGIELVHTLGLSPTWAAQ